MEDMEELPPREAAFKCVDSLMGDALKDGRQVVVTGVIEVAENKYLPFMYSGIDDGEIGSRLCLALANNFVDSLKAEMQFSVPAHKDVAGSPEDMLAGAPNLTEVSDA